MRQISLWSKHHRWTARFLIVLLHFILVALGLLLGDLLALTGIILPEIVVYASSLSFLLFVACYPSKKDKAKYSNFYRFRKLMDLALVTISFVIIIGLGNSSTDSPPSSQPAFGATYAAASVRVQGTSVSNKDSAREVRYTSKKGLQKAKQQLKKRIRTIRKQYKNASGGEKAVLIILAILVALALLALVTALSCSLFCAGSTGGALTLLILGFGLIIFLLVKVIMRINRGKPAPKRSEPAEETIPDSQPSV